MQNVNIVPGIPGGDAQLMRLLALKNRKGFGMLAIVFRRGDVVFAASPVPRLAGYEIVAASSNGLYDIWKNGKLITPDQTCEQVQDWIHTNTPKWLYDDSDVTERQKALVQSWLVLFNKRYPGVLDIR